MDLPWLMELINHTYVMKAPHPAKTQKGRVQRASRWVNKWSFGDDGSPREFREVLSLSYPSCPMYLVHLAISWVISFYNKQVI